MKPFSFSIYLFGAAMIAVVSVAEAGESTPHDALATPTTGSTFVERDHRPWAEWYRGCHAYSPVDDEGNFNGGLEESLDEGGSCRDSDTHMAISRSKCVDGMCALMYMYYFPKDNGCDGGEIFYVGHRHDFEEVVIFIRESDGAFYGAAYSAHGDYYTSTESRQRDGRLAVSARYSCDSFTHSFVSAKTYSNNDDAPGGRYTTVSWDLLTNSAKEVINNYRSYFSNGVPALRDSAFLEKVTEAAQSIDDPNRCPTSRCDGVVFRINWNE